MHINTRSQKVRQELWVGLGVASILALGVLAFNAQYADAPLDYNVESGMVVDEKKEETKLSTGSFSAKPTAPKATHVYAIASSLPNTSNFASVLRQTGVDSLLSSGGPFSVFVPTDAALTLANVSSMTAAEKERFAKYHIIKDRAVDINALRAGNVYAASGDQLNFVVVGDEKLERVNSSRILSQHSASNGVIYIIDAPLFPPHKSGF